MRTTLLVLLTIPLTACATAPPASAKRVDPAEPTQTKRETNPTYRVVERVPPPEKNIPDTVPFASADPFVDVSVPADQRESVASAFTTELDESAWAFVGNFASRDGDELLVISRAGELAVHEAGGGVLARRTLGIIDPEEPPRAAQLVDDRLELVVIRRESEESDASFSVFRVIGAAVAEVFRAPLSDGTPEFVQRGDERAIQVAREERVDLFRWNRWEGMFRIPEPAPTAPRIR